MSADKYVCPFGVNQTANEEMQHFLHLKEKETERSRLKALEAMILLEHRNRGISVKKAEYFIPKPIGSQYLDDGKLKFTPDELKKVQRQRHFKVERIESHFKNEKRSNLYLNQRYPFVLRSVQDKPKKMTVQSNSGFPDSV